MEPTQIGLVVLSAILVLLALRFPVTVVLAVAAASGAFLVHVLADDAAGMAGAAAQTASTLWSGLSDLFTSAPIWLLPLFIAFGRVAVQSGIATRLHEAALIRLGHRPGGAAIAAIIGCGGFAALSGSSVACATTMGRLCLPGMQKRGYDPRLAGAAVAAGGTLGSLIPPSILLILFGILSGVPVVSMLAAGILPGLLSMAAMVAVVILWTGAEPDIAPGGSADPLDRRHVLPILWPAALLFVILIGGPLSGLLSLMQAGGICIVLALVIGAGQHRLDLRGCLHLLRDTLRQTAILFLAVAAAKVFFDFVALTGLDMALVSRVEAAGIPPLGVVGLIVLAYLLLGLTLEPVGILLLSLPFVLPLAEAQGLDLIWFGIIIAKLLEIALMAPPFGLNVFIVSSISRGIAPATIFAGVGHFLLMDGLVLLALILFPAISTVIPSLM